MGEGLGEGVGGEGGRGAGEGEWGGRGGRTGVHLVLKSDRSCNRVKPCIPPGKKKPTAPPHCEAVYCVGDERVLHFQYIFARYVM